jgi:hypothetical protein
MFIGEREWTRKTNRFPVRGEYPVDRGDALGV